MPVLALLLWSGCESERRSIRCRGSGTFLGFSRVAENLVPDDSFGRFVQIFVERVREMFVASPIMRPPSEARSE
jgi:hypothetical protein